MENFNFATTLKEKVIFFNEKFRNILVVVTSTLVSIKRRTEIFLNKLLFSVKLLKNGILCKKKRVVSKINRFFQKVAK